MEKISLVEAFASSMPEGIRKFLTGRGKNWISSLTGGKNIALDRANFINYPIPKTNRDPIFKDETKIKFYIFKNGAVYITDVNDDFQYIIWNDNWIYNKYIPAKGLIENSTAIYYLDLNDPNNFNTEDKVERSKNKVSLNDPNRRVDDKNFPSDVKWAVRRGEFRIDKSGYIVDPNRLTKKMIEKGLYNPAKKTNAIYKKLVSLKKDLLEAMDSIDLPNVEDGKIQSLENNSAGNILSNLRNAMSSYSSAITYYNYLVNDLEELQKQKDSNILNNKEYAVSCKNTLDRRSSSIENNLDDVEQRISKFIGYSIDWDTEDEEDI